jgi:hypothetical protein
MPEKDRSNLKIIIVVALVVLWLGIDLKDLYDMSHGIAQARLVAQTFQLSYTGDVNQLVAFATSRMEENPSSRSLEILISITTNEKSVVTENPEVNSSWSGWAVDGYSHGKGKLTIASYDKLTEYAYEAYIFPSDTPIKFLTGGAEIKSEVTFQIYDNMLTQITRYLGLGCMFIKEIQFTVDEKDLPIVLAMLNYQQ